jgi:carboxyl-terminal processing protease
MNRARSFSLRVLGTGLFALFALVLSAVPACRTSSHATHAAHADAPRADPALTLEQRRAIFQEAWKQIQEKHFDPAMNGVDWDAVRAHIAPKVDAARDEAEFLAALEEMIKSLGQSHIGIGPPLPDRKAMPLASSKPEPAAAGSGEKPKGALGMHAGWLDGKLVVTHVEQGSPADLAHMRPGDEILGLDGSPTSSLVESLPLTLGEHWQGVIPYAFDEATTGPIGGRVRLDIASADGTPNKIELVRTAPGIPFFDFGLLGSLLVEFESRMLPGEILYLRFTPCIVDAEQLVEKALSEHKDARGVILDLRGNPGGVGGIAMAVARLFVDRPVELGTMRTRENPELRFFVHPDENPYRGPFVILVDGSTASTAEILSAGLQAVGRARIVGSTSLGMALPSIVVELPYGWRLQTVIADFQLPNGKAVEGNGVTPDVAVATTLSDLRAQRDRGLEVAVAELSNAPTIAGITVGAEERLHGAASEGGPIEVSPEAEAVMGHVSAAMHADRMAAHKSMRVRSHLSIMGTEGTVEQVREAPNKSRVLSRNPLAGEAIQVYDGEHGWSSNAIQGIRELKGPELAVLKRGTRFDANVAWREIYKKVEILQPGKEDGRRAILVQSTPHDGEGEPVLTYLDPETWLPFRSEFTLETEMGKIHLAIDLSDYREFDGVPQATRSVTKLNGLEIVTTVDSVEWDVAVDEHLFDKPTRKETP